MNLKEPLAALRVIRATLKDNTGTLLAANHVFAIGDLKLIKPDNTIANTIALPAPTPGSVLVGAFDITLDTTEIDQRGTYRLQLHNAAALTDQEWIITVDYPGAGELDAVIEGAGQYDGAGEAGTSNVTLAGAVRELLALLVNAATGMNGANPVFKSRGGGKNRVVMQLANGNRAITSRDDS